MRRLTITVFVLVTACGVGEAQEQLLCTRVVDAADETTTMTCRPYVEEEPDIRVDAVRWTSYSVEADVTAVRRSYNDLTLRFIIQCENGSTERNTDQTFEDVAVGAFTTVTSFHSCEGDVDQADVQPKFADWVCEGCGVWR
ncbi:MAG: hypothetical protein OXH04_06565 [Acidobacteria bacterium]|nr:hypothetical protein [Acidobacteriota bacterium]